MNRILTHTGWALVAALLSTPALKVAAQNEKGNDAKWYVSAGPGWIQFEGDEAPESGPALSTHLGYDYNERWGYEGSFFVAPNLGINTVGHTFIDETTGEVVHERVKLANASSTTAFGFSLDGLFHFTRWERVDPYFTLGVGAIAYTKDLDGASFACRRGGDVSLQ